MTAHERAKERGCELPLSLIGKIHGMKYPRQELNKEFNSNLEKFDRLVDEARDKWNSICSTKAERKYKKPVKVGFGEWR